MNKIILISFISLITFFLGQESIRYIGIDYVTEKKNLPNSQKIYEFFDRSFKYRKLVKEINKDVNDKHLKVLNTSNWIYKNIKKIKEGDIVIDNHPWTIVERAIGQDDQHADLLSVLLFYQNIDSFFNMKINSIWHPITFFSIEEKKWSILDQYYGIYFLDNNLNFFNLDQDKEKNFIMHHLTMGKVNNNNFKDIFINKKFDNFEDVKSYYFNLLNNLPNNKKIEETHIYERGGRSYVQTPLHRFLFELRKLKN